MNRARVHLVLLVLLLAGPGHLAWGQQNQIQNAEFDSGLDSWFLYGGAGFTADVVSDARLSGANAALLDVTDPSVASIGIAQGNLKFERGKKYPIGVTARADKEREMVILIQLYKPEVPTWVDIVLERPALTTEPQTFLYEYTHNDDSMADHPNWVATMYLMLKGQWWSMKGADVASKVWVDRVHVGEQPPLLDSTVWSASEPEPADGATDVPRDTGLSWKPGDRAATHDVYLGTVLEDVGAADTSDPRGVLVSQGRAETQFELDDPLEYGQVYYWRIDEVNAAPDYAVTQGDIWSFTAEPYAYPITKLTVTASGQNTTSPATATIDGSGLVDDQHSIDMGDMWIVQAMPAWIEYTFDKEYVLHELWVWNANSQVETWVGWGARTVVIEYSRDGQTWTPLENVPEFTQGTGVPTYKANTVVSFSGVRAKHVRLTINAVWNPSPSAAAASLSEVRFFYVPVQAFEPTPADGAAGVDLAATLNWRPGRKATSHQVYLGADANAMAEGTVASETVTDHRYTPASLTFGTTYYWKVDEVGDDGTCEGDVWSFTSREYESIDDFESYTDNADAKETIWHAWLDGMTTGASGSQVGYDNVPFAETSIVHGGKQSMPLTYDNDGTFREGTQYERTGVPFYSEAEREFDPLQDWSVHGATELSLWVRGYPAVTAVTVTETAGKMTLIGKGADIWGNSDEFVYAFKTLTGDGTMVARVVSNGTGSSTWAKGGVMIRDSLNGGSTHAMMVITAGGGNGANFQYRQTTNGVSGNNDIIKVVTPPYWVKINRSGDLLTGYASADSKTWSAVGAVTIPMTAPVQIGLCAVSTMAGEDRVFEFDNIATTGDVTGSWQGVMINSPLYNDAVNMSLTVVDSTGRNATVTSATAATEPDWTQWTIPMSDFADVNFAKVKKMVITLGDKTATAPGGTGIVFIDDIAFGHSAR
ncbi:MAG: carbohydrate binding domain-containing protein [Phycisphaerae bacterium]|nr:carbohydrate binding domain-containing protein [Phycisphaerae bacterium]